MAIQNIDDLMARLKRVMPIPAQLGTPQASPSAVPTTAATVAPPPAASPTQAQPAAPQQYLQQSPTQQAILQQLKSLMGPQQPPTPMQGITGALAGFARSGFMDPAKAQALEGQREQTAQEAKVAKLKMLMEQSRAMSEDQYRNAELQHQNRATDVAASGQKSLDDYRKVQTRTALEKAGYRISDLTGGIEAVPEAELSAESRSKIQMQRDHDSLMQSQQNLTQAKTEFERLKVDPQSFVNQQAATKIKQAQERLSIAEKDYGRKVDEFNAKYLGRGPSGDALPGVGTTAEGQPIGPAVANAGKLNATAEQRATAAKSLLALGPDVIQQINANRDKIGAIVGKGEDFMLKQGIKDPELRTLQSNLSSLAPLIATLHGGRNTEYMMREFKDAAARLGEDPDNAIAAMRAQMGVSNTILDQVRDLHPGTQGLGGPAKPKTATPETKTINGVIYEKVNGGWRKR